MFVFWGIFIFLYILYISYIIFSWPAFGGPKILVYIYKKSRMFDRKIITITTVFVVKEGRGGTNKSVSSNQHRRTQEREKRKSSTLMMWDKCENTCLETHIHAEIVCLPRSDCAMHVRISLLVSTVAEHIAGK